MTATNHALTGAFIGCLIANPLLAIPLALASHFICDALPHFGADQRFLRSRGFLTMLIIDASLCVGLVLVLVARQPEHWLLIAACAFVATTPDFAWLPGYLRVKRGRAFQRGRSRLLTWASDIQWFQKPIGAVVELAWFVAAVALLLPFMR